jgi:hypothetical protein
MVFWSIQSRVRSDYQWLRLIGLAAKNAILIVEFAKLKRDEGKSLVEAALEGAKLRLRPILMTSFSFILGCVPLMLASGSGAASRGVMGTAVVFGMTIATLASKLRKTRLQRMTSCRKSGIRWERIVVSPMVWPRNRIQYRAILVAVEPICDCPRRGRRITSEFHGVGFKDRSKRT